MILVAINLGLIMYMVYRSRRDVASQIANQVEKFQLEAKMLLENFNDKRVDILEGMNTFIQTLLEKQNSFMKGINDSNNQNMMNLTNSFYQFQEMMNKNNLSYLDTVRQQLSESNENFKQCLENIEATKGKMLEEVPHKVLQTIQGGISPIKGKSGELAVYLKMLSEYNRIIPLGKPIDFIGIKNDSLDFIEIKTGQAKLSPEEKNIQELIANKQINFLMIRPEISILTPKDLNLEIAELPETIENSVAMFIEGLKPVFLEINEENRKVVVAKIINGLFEHFNNY